MDFVFDLCVEVWISDDWSMGMCILLDGFNRTMYKR